MNIALYGARTVRAVLSAAAISFALTTMAHATAMATASRTFVSHSGSDSNASTSCLANNPCRTLQGAYNVTAPGGEIVVLDGGGYGALAITTSVIVTAVQPASISVRGGTTGVTITGNVVVILRNLDISGGGAANTTGMSLGSGGYLVLQHSALATLTTGLSVTSAKADLIDTDILSNTTGILTNGTGVDSQNSNGTNVGATEVRLNRGNVVGNTTAFTMNNPGNPNSATYNNTTIWLWDQGNVSTNIVGNGTLATVTGSGNSCITNNDCVADGGYEIGVGSPSNFQ